MKRALRLVVLAAAFSAPALASDVDDVMATPSRVNPAAEGAAKDEVGDYLKDVHGEVTAMVGTGGSYGVSATAELPLGENGFAILSFSKTKGPLWISPYSLAPSQFREDPDLPFGFVERPWRGTP